MGVNNQVLREIINEHSLSIDFIVEATGYSLDTVKAWRTDPESLRFRAMSDDALMAVLRAVEAAKESGVSRGK